MKHTEKTSFHTDQWWGKLSIEIGGKLGTDFDTIGIHLGVDNAALKDIKSSYPGAAKQWGKELLIEWRQEHADWTHEKQITTLQNALEDSGRNDLKVKVEKAEAKRVAAQEQAKQPKEDQGAKDELDLPSPPAENPKDAQLEARLKKLKS
ncbi:unnamed protein product [Owenia fusiformis]|uniref:Death domain-containing protein n=1 Tax=Owenia fusiformis TaxID=6347 RepID=A0A8S4Q9F4_OWEFU|nr:unnamed protein product [Owenia fusiformis]